MPIACLQCVEAGKQHRIAAAATEQAACENVLWHAVPSADAATPGSVGLKPPDLEHLHTHGQLQVRPSGGAQPGGSQPDYDTGNTDGEDAPRWRGCSPMPCAPGWDGRASATSAHGGCASHLLPLFTGVPQLARRLSLVVSLALHPQRPLNRSCGRGQLLPRFSPSYNAARGALWNRRDRHGAHLAGTPSSRDVLFVRKCRGRQHCGMAWGQARRRLWGWAGHLAAL